MKLLFERSRPGRGNDLLPPCDVPVTQFDPSLLRGAPLRLPEIAEVDLGRHYTELAKQTHGVNDGFYPLGSCTMKYNPRVNEEAAAQPGFTQLHPLQPVETVQGALEVLATAERLGLLGRRVEETLRRLAGELRAGSITADPCYKSAQDNACLWCEYAEACRFTEGEGGDRRRYLPKLSATRVWDILEGGGDDGGI